MAVSVRKDTINRLHKHCQRGEKHNNLVNRLLDACNEEKIDINLSNDTVEKLMVFTGCSDMDEALNMLLDKYVNVIKKGENHGMEK